MTITEKHRTEYKFIDQMMNELTQVMQRIAALEASAEEDRRIIKELRKSGMMYREVIEQLPNRIYIKDADLAYVFCNSAYAHDLNITPDEISGKSHYDYVPRELAEKILAEENEILRSGVMREREEQYFVSGQELTVLSTKTPVRNENGEIIGLQVVLQDITEDKRQKESLALQFKNLEDLLVQGQEENNALKIDLATMTAQRDQLEADNKSMQESMNKQTAASEAVIDKLKNDLQRETTERKDAVELLRNSFTQIQDLMNSVQHLMGSSSSEDP